MSIEAKREEETYDRLHILGSVTNELCRKCRLNPKMQELMQKLAEKLGVDFKEKIK